MTRNVGWLRATLLIPVILLAMVGGGAVLTGTAAADAQNLTVTNEGQTAAPGGNLSYDVTDDVSLNEHDIHVWIDTNDNGVYDPTERNQTLNSSSGSTLSGRFVDVELSPGQYTLMAVENASLNESQHPQTTANVTVDVGPPDMVSAVAYTETSGTQAHGAIGDTVVEVMFNESLSDGSGGTEPAAGDMLVELTNGSTANATLNDGGSGDAEGDRRVVLNLGGGIDPPAVEAVVVKTAATFTDTAGNRIRSNAEPAQLASTTVAQNGDNTTAFNGEQVAIVGDVDGEEIYITDANGNIILDDSTGTDSKVFVWDTGSQSADREYNIMFDGRTQPDYLLGGDVSLALEDLGLTVTADNTLLTTEHDVTGTVSTDAPNRTIDARLLKTDSPVATKVLTLNGTTGTVNFGQQAEGDYRIDVEDRTTGLTARTVIIHVDPPTPSPTPTATPTPTPTPTLSPTPTPVPPPTQTDPTTPLPSPTGTTGSQEFEMVAPPPTPTDPRTSTVTTGPPGGPSGTAAPTTPPADDIFDFLGLIWDGATDSVGAVTEIISEGISRLFP